MNTKKYKDLSIKEIMDDDESLESQTAINKAFNKTILERFRKKFLGWYLRVNYLALFESVFELTKKLNTNNL